MSQIKILKAIYKKRKPLAVGFVLHSVTLQFLLVKQAGGRHWHLQSTIDWVKHWSQTLGECLVLTLEKGPEEANDGVSVFNTYGSNSTFHCKIVTFTAVDGNYTYLIDGRIDFAISGVWACKISSPHNFR